MSLADVLRPFPKRSVAFNPNTYSHEGLKPINGFERLDIVYPATTKGFLLFTLSLNHPENPFNTLDKAVVIPEIRPKDKAVPPIEMIKNGKMLVIISLETSVKKETSPIKKIGTETPKMSFCLVSSFFSIDVLIFLSDMNHF